jgi:hypothetical protein
MTNHVHLIAASSGKEKMENIVCDMKKFTAYEIINVMKENRQ